MANWIGLRAALRRTLLAGAALAAAAVPAPCSWNSTEQSFGMRSFTCLRKAARTL